MLILREAFYGVMRHEDIREDLGIPRSVLTDRLSKLIIRGLLEKRPYQEAGDRKRHGYGLTDKGRGLALSFIALTQWSEAHIVGGPGPVDIVDQASGKALKAALIDEDGKIVAVDQAITRIRATAGDRER